MSEEIRLWGFAICSAAIVAGVINALAPNSGSGRAVKYIVGIFLSVTVIAPFVGGFEVEMQDFDKYDSYYIEENSDEMLIEETKRVVGEKIEGYLLNEGIYLNGYDIKIIENQNKGLEFESIILNISSEYFDRQDEIYSIINSLTGIPPSIVFMR